MFLFFRYLLGMVQLILSPRRGWEDIAIDNYQSSKLLTAGYMPLIIITSLTCLPEYFYSSDVTVVGVIEDMIACFVKFLVSYYIASLFFSLYIPSCTGGELSMNKNNTFILYTLGLLALLDMLMNLLPMVPDMLYLLPVYVFFVMWRGLNYMEVKFDGVLPFMMLNFFAVIVPLFLLTYIFNLVIQQ